MNGPYDARDRQNWDDALAKLKDFNQNVTFTPGNAGTLDMLNRGEIAMGPVWVDMFYTWQADGRLAPDVKLKLIGPGMPGQPMYYVTPKNAAQPGARARVHRACHQPRGAGRRHRQKFNWYPGIDAQYVKPELDQAAWNKLFTDVTPEDSRPQRQAVPDRALFRRHPRSLRAEGRELRRSAPWPVCRAESPASALQPQSPGHCRTSRSLSEVALPLNDGGSAEAPSPEASSGGSG